MPASPYARRTDTVLSLVTSQLGKDMTSISHSFQKVTEASTKVLDALPDGTFAFRFVEFNALDFGVFGSAIDMWRALKRSDLYYYKVASITSAKYLLDMKAGPLTDWLRQREEDEGRIVAKISDTIMFPVGKSDHIYHPTNFARNPHFELHPVGRKAEPLSV